MSDASFENLISAYLDNELGPEERAQAERILAEDAEMASLMETMADHSRALKSLPRYKLDDQFANRLMESASFAAAFSAAPRLSKTADELRGKPKNWRAAAVTIGSLAALILVTLMLDPTQLVKDTSFAGVPETSAHKSMDSEPMDEEESDLAGTVEKDAGTRFKSKSAGEFDADDFSGKIGKAESNQPAPSTIHGQQSDDLDAPGQQSVAIVDAQPAKKGGINRDKSVVALEPIPGGATNEKESSKLVENAKLQKKLADGAIPNDTRSQSESRQNQLAQLQNVLPVSKAGSQPLQDLPGIEHVIEVRFPANIERDNYYFGELQTALARNDITLGYDPNKSLEENQARPTGSMKFAPDVGDSEALFFIVAPPSKMRSVLSELVEKNVRVSAFYGFPFEDQQKLAMLRDQDFVQSADLYGKQKSSNNTAEFSRQRKRNPLPDLAQSDEPAAAAGAELGMSIQKESSQNQLGQRRAEGQAGDQAIAGGQAMDESGLALRSRGIAGVKTEMPSIAQRLSKTDPNMYRSLGKKPVGVDGQLAEGLGNKNGAYRGGGGGGRQFSDASESKANEADAKSDSAKTKDAMNRLSDAYKWNIESVNRAFGLLPDPTESDQTPRRYLLFVRQDPSSIDPVRQSAPAANAQPKSADK